MSAQATYIRCHGCDFKGVISYRGITLCYYLPSGETVTGYRDRGWCYECMTNRDIERSFNVNSIEEKLQELQEPKPRSLLSIIFGIGNAHSEKDQETIKGLQSALHIAKTRKSPPRCLTCGGDRTVPLLFGSNGISLSFIHDCGKRLFLLPPEEDAPRISRRALQLDFDPEGNLLRSSDA